MKCQICGHDNREGARFCDSCGAELVAPDASTPLDIGLSPDFVGRHPEMDELSKALGDALEGRI